MPRTSAGLLLYRVRAAGLEVLLVHPGGPFWAAKDAGAWSIPKGEVGADEGPLQAAIREVREELGIELTGPFEPLTPVRQAGGKLVHAWAIAAEVDPAAIVSDTVELEWPPRSGRRQTFPEVDRVEWFSLDEARRRILSGQRPLIDELVARRTYRPIG
ncbi:MAG: NUDIX domain-containing protein [Vicinamibacterales bacterium]